MVFCVCNVPVLFLIHPYYIISVCNVNYDQLSVSIENESTDVQNPRRPPIQR